MLLLNNFVMYESFVCLETGVLLQEGRLDTLLVFMAGVYKSVLVSVFEFQVSTTKLKP